jgi:hypothetical protein
MIDFRVYSVNELYQRVFNFGLHNRSRLTLKAISNIRS